MLPESGPASFPPAARPLGFFLVFRRLFSIKLFVLYLFFYINLVRFFPSFLPFPLFSSQFSVSQYPYLFLTSVIVPDASWYLLVTHAFVWKMERERKHNCKKHGECVRCSHIHIEYRIHLGTAEELARILQRILLKLSEIQGTGEIWSCKTFSFC